MVSRFLGLILFSFIMMGNLAGPLATRGAAEGRSPRAIIVFGGSGQLGSEVVRALHAAGHEVTVFVRPSSQLDRIAGLSVGVVQGDATLEVDVDRALAARRYDVVVDALGRSGADVEFFATTGRIIARQARAHGVGHLILHSSVGVGRSAAVFPADRLASMQRLFEAKKVGEDAAMASGVEYTIIRNAVLREPLTSGQERPRLVADESAWGTVTRRGLAQLTLECIDAPACRNRIFHAVDDELPVIR